MYNGIIGLQTPRGSGTNGYVQTNKFFMKSSKIAAGTKGTAGDGVGFVRKQPNMDILEHDRKRQIELKLVLLEDELVDHGYTQAEIAEKLVQARKTLTSSEETTAAIVVADYK